MSLTFLPLAERLQTCIPKRLLTTSPAANTVHLTPLETGNSHICIWAFPSFTLQIHFSDPIQGSPPPWDLPQCSQKNEWPSPVLLLYWCGTLLLTYPTVPGVRLACVWVRFPSRLLSRSDWCHMCRYCARAENSLCKLTMAFLLLGHPFIIDRQCHWDSRWTSQWHNQIFSEAEKENSRAVPPHHGSGSSMNNRTKGRVWIKVAKSIA